MENTPWISLLGQIPLVGIFIWFVLTMMDRESAERASRDDKWQTFLREQREANNNALARLAEEIKCMAMELAQMRQVLANHEIQTERRMKFLEKLPKQDE